MAVIKTNLLTYSFMLTAELPADERLKRRMKVWNLVMWCSESMSVNTHFSAVGCFKQYLLITVEMAWNAGEHFQSFAHLSKSTVTNGHFPYDWGSAAMRMCVWQRQQSVRSRQRPLLCCWPGHMVLGVVSCWHPLRWRCLSSHLANINTICLALRLAGPAEVGWGDRS